MAENCENQVFNHLKKYTPTELPFDFSIRGRDMRLIGKSRIRRDVKPETIYARIVSPFLSEMRKTLAKIDYDDFETLCAASLRLAGATEAFALRTHDEGGIDFFGRIPLRNQAVHPPTAPMCGGYKDALGLRQMAVLYYGRPLHIGAAVSQNPLKGVKDEYSKRTS